MSRSLQRRCSSCHRPFDGHPVFVQDTAFCCGSCAGGALCTCFVEADLAEDGVDGIGLPFGEASLEVAPAGLIQGARPAVSRAG